MRIKNAVVSAASRARIAGLSHERLKLDQKKGAQLPPFPTTLVAPDPEDATSTILELDERMARLCSKKPTTPGCGLPYVARRDRWSPMLSVIGVGKTCQRLWEAIPSTYRTGHCETSFWAAFVRMTLSFSRVGPDA